MPRLIVIVSLLLLATPALAQRTQPEDRRTAERSPPSTHNHQTLAGDTFADAFPVLETSFLHTGTTIGYADDYDEVCPYTGSTSPDVVYGIHLYYDTWVEFDLCGSSYDTKLYLYGEDLQLLACNDDYYFDDICGVYVSYIGYTFLEAGMKYFLVIDGYGGDAGEYELVIIEPPPREPTATAPVTWGEIKALYR